MPHTRSNEVLFTQNDSKESLHLFLLSRLFLSMPLAVNKFTNIHNLERALVYVCYPSYGFITSYFNTKEGNISTASQSGLFIGAYSVCLALLHSDFIHKKSYRMQQKFGKISPLGTNYLFPITSGGMSEANSKYSPKRSTPCSTLSKI